MRSRETQGKKITVRQRNLYWLTRTNLHSVSFPSKWHPTINEQEDIQRLTYYEKSSCTWVFERWARISDKPARQWACIWWASSSPHCRWPRGKTASHSCPVAPSGRCTYPDRCPSGWSSAGHCVTAPPGCGWQGGSGRVSPGSVSPSGWSQIPVEEDKKKEWKNVCHGKGDVRPHISRICFPSARVNPNFCCRKIERKSKQMYTVKLV